ncbi:MAG: PDZ domain-containing protein [Candidatus Eisenbacteria bacterium]|uniref:PDZ domain-containing protein n=1 Tax=Eiseniibacteriota bacterium TaxID=2212470 RepID=A0A9D6L9I2_UNCEI|nr:PDZ domain-containing protein [Candidatus Eisenbacteria bacterium]
MVMLRMTVRGAGGRDTSGLFVLDTGAGFLALDRELATGLGIVDTAVAGRADAVDLATSPLPRMSLGNWSLDQVQPVLTIDGSVIRRVTDRPVLGLLGQRPLEDRCVVLDYGEKTATLVPMVRESEDTQVADEAADDSSDADAAARSRAAIGFALSPGAVAVRFALAGDGKILVRGRVADPRPPRWSRALNLLVDTGATKTVLFDEAVSGVIAHAGAWPTLRGLSAPTLIGAAEARLSMVPALEIAGIARRGRPRPAARVAGIDVGLIRSDLSGVLSRVTRTTIHGLLGYSFLKHFRVAIDYPHRVLWLDPIPHYRDERPYEYCHVGLELERRDGAAIVTGVAAGSPAARAGIRREDELVALDGAPSRTLDLMDLARRMEGPPGSTVTIVMRRGAVERTHRLVRRRLL